MFYLVGFRTLTSLSLSLIMHKIVSTCPWLPTNDFTCFWFFLFSFSVPSAFPHVAASPPYCLIKNRTKKNKQTNRPSPFAKQCTTKHRAPNHRPINVLTAVIACQIWIAADKILPLTCNNNNNYQHEYADYCWSIKMQKLNKMRYRCHMTESPDRIPEHDECTPRPPIRPGDF